MNARTLPFRLCHVVVSLSMMAGVVNSSFAAPVIYMTEESTGNDRLLRYQDGTLTTVGHTGFFDVRGLAFDSASTTLFGVSRGGAGLSRLVTISLGTGLATAVSGNDYLPPGSNTAEITFDAAGNMFGTGHLLDHSTADTLLSVNTSTGVATPINPGGYGLALFGLAFRNANNTLYATSIDGLLYTIDTTLGTATLLGAITGSNGGVARIAFDQTTDTLYGITFNNQLVTVDLAGRTATEVAQFDTLGQIYAITIADPVPEPSTVALLAAGLLSLLWRFRMLLHRQRSRLGRCPVDRQHDVH